MWLEAVILILIIIGFWWFLNKDELVIVSAHYKEDLDWLTKSPWRVVVCDKPGGAAMSFPPDPTCTLSENRGREASSYLKYIIENYDNLPERIAFIHGHEDADHQKYPRGMLQAIKDAKKDLDFVSLNNWIHLKKDAGPAPQLPVHPNSHEFGDHPKVYEEMRRNWDTVFRPILGIDIPNYFRFPSSAQFVVSKKAILRQPKDVYQKLYDFMMEPGSDDWARGVVMEFIWHMLFTGQGHDICNDPSDGPMYQTCSDEAYRNSRFNF
jgi:Protein of unknown function (DUF3431)